jgi:NO-binding membrane sensor protein with MHYT domain
MPIKQDRGITEIALELKDLTIAYAKQETVDPIKLLGRYVGLGLAGALLIGVGVILLTFAGMRALQVETGTALTGNWTWVPYLAAIVFLAIVMAIFARVISRKPRRTRP